MEGEYVLATEKQIYDFLKKVSKNKDLNIMLSSDYKHGEQLPNNELLYFDEMARIISEFERNKFIFPQSIQIYHINYPPHTSIPTMVRYPRLTLEGNKFMKDYRRESGWRDKVKSFFLYLFALIGAINTVIETIIKVKELFK